MADPTFQELLSAADDALVDYLSEIYDETAFVPNMDPRWPRLLAAARLWRASLIPKTSTSMQGPTRLLVEAIEAFESERPT